MAINALFEAVPAVLDTYTLAAASVSADWYENEREAEEITGRFAVLVEPPKEEGRAVEKFIGFAATALTRDEPDFQLAQTRIDGGVQRRIANSSRTTVMDNSIRDPKAKGWQRVANPGACTFCKLLEAKGTVYSRRTVDFGAHDDCNCSATVAWKKKPIPVKPYTPSERGYTDAEKAATKAWVKANET